MPHYCFHVMDGQELTDDTGAELPNLDAAKAEALRLTGAVLSEDAAGNIWRGSPWRIIVSDNPSPEDGRSLLTLIISAKESVTSMRPSLFGVHGG